MLSDNSVCLKTVREVYGTEKTPYFVPGENSELLQKALIVHDYLCQVSEGQRCALRTSCGHVVLFCFKYLEQRTPTKSFAKWQKQGKPFYYYYYCYCSFMQLIN